jgi:ferredoxin
VQLCTGCGECVEVCPVDAIDLVDAPGLAVPA